MGETKAEEVEHESLYNDSTLLPRVHHCGAAQKSGIGMDGSQDIVATYLGTFRTTSGELRLLKPYY
jgi:hypothetical protein